MTAKERLVNELKEIKYKYDMETEDIADFILADRARIVAPLVKFKTKYPELYTGFGEEAVNNIDETLKLAGGGE